MRRDLTNLLASQKIFWELQEVAKQNPKVLSTGDFFDWMCSNYVATVSIGIRSFTDQSHGSHSLWRMLYEILENPGVIERAAHVRMYVAAPGAEYGHSTFDNIVGRGRTFLSQRAIRTDLRRIEDSSERVRRFVNKRIAHRNSPGRIRRMPKFSEVDSALRTLDEILCKYNLLLTGQGMESLKPIFQHDWRHVLWEPWIPEGSSLRPGD